MFAVVFLEKLEKFLSKIARKQFFIFLWIDVDSD